MIGRPKYKNYIDAKLRPGEVRHAKPVQNPKHARPVQVLIYLPSDGASYPVSMIDSDGHLQWCHRFLFGDPIVVAEPDFDVAEDYAELKRRYPNILGPTLEIVSQAPDDVAERGVEEA